MKQVKPILIIRLPEMLSVEDYKATLIRAKELVNHEYHIIAISEPNESNSIKFEAIYEKDFNEVKYNELIKMIEDSLKQ